MKATLQIYSDDGTLKIFDFGLCTCIKVRRRSDIFYEMTGNKGSLRYMAPEVANKKPYGEKVDVHSFGIVLWQMARDKIPFDGMDASGFLTNVVRNKERPKLDKQWPPEFCALLVSCWHHNPISRPSFRDVVTILDTLLGSAPSSDHHHHHQSDAHDSHHNESGSQQQPVRRGQSSIL